MRQQKVSTQTHYSEINKGVKRSIRKDKRNWIGEQAKLAEVEKEEDKGSFIILRECCLKENLG